MLMWFTLLPVAALWLVFGSIQDWKTREISDWVTLSLLAIGIGIRILFALEAKDFSIVSLAALSSVLLLAISFLFYYTKVFAGGDFKLLTGLGPYIPGMTFVSVMFNTLFVVISLLLLGFVYSIVMSSIIASKNKSLFVKNFRKKASIYFYIVPAVLIALFFALKIGDNVIITLFGIVSVALLAYPYLLSVDGCMLRLYKPNKLTPGDWIMHDVSVGKRVVRATVHGLSEADISLLRKYHKSVMVKEGIPFVPVFLLCFVVMVFFFVAQGADFLQVWLAGLV